MLLVHGLLHLLGQDHEEGKAEAAEMAASEDAVIRQLGWGDQGGLITASFQAGNGTAAAVGTTSASRDQTRILEKQRSVSWLTCFLTPAAPGSVAQYAP